jgi:hypothetical protein
MPQRGAEYRGEKEEGQSIPIRRYFGLLQIKRKKYKKRVNLRDQVLDKDYKRPIPSLLRTKSAWGGSGV